MIILFVEGSEPINGKIGDAREIPHLVEKIFDLLAPFPEENLHFRVLEDEGASSIEFLRQQGLDQFVRHLDQRNVTLRDPIVDFIQPLKAEKRDEGDENREEPTG